MIKLLFTYLFGGAASGVVSILSTFLITRMFSTEAYAKAMLFSSLLNILFCFCNMGMDQVFVRYFYEINYKHKLSLLFLRCLSVVFLGVVFVSFVLFFLGHDLLQWLEIDDPILIPLLVMGMILFSLHRFTQLISRLKEQAILYGVADFVGAISFLMIFLTFFYVFSTDYLTLIFSRLISMALVVVWLLFLYRKDILPIAKTKEPFFQLEELKVFLKYGTPSLFSLSLAWLFINLDKYFILKYSSYHELGIYTAAFDLASPLVFIQSAFTTAWAPRMNNMLIHRPFKSKKIFFSTFEKLSAALTCLFLALVFFKNDLILILGSNFHPAVNVFPWLLFAPYFWALSEVVVAGIVKSKKSYWSMPISFAAVCVNIMGCCLLIPMMGATGAAISSALSYFIFFLARWAIAFRYYPFKIYYAKFATYLVFICAYIVFSDRAKYSLTLLFMVMVLFFEYKWLLKGARTGMNSLLLKFSSRATHLDVFQKSFHK
jgi:O-antigen/teichoic acid export membrane protein